MISFQEKQRENFRRNASGGASVSARAARPRDCPEAHAQAEATARHPTCPDGSSPSRLHPEDVIAMLSHRDSPLCCSLLLGGDERHHTHEPHGLGSDDLARTVRGHRRDARIAISRDAATHWPLRVRRSKDPVRLCRLQGLLPTCSHRRSGMYCLSGAYQIHSPRIP